MSGFNPNNPGDFESDSENDNLDGLAWNEFDWEQYLRAQDDAVFRYLGFYETFANDSERLTKISQCMGWIAPADSEENANADDGDDFDEPYTIHKNCIFVSTKAIYLGLTRAWERIADNAARVPQALALAYQASLHRGENNAMLAVHALDYGDYAMTVSLFKRALGDLNRSLTLLDEKAAQHSPALAQYRERALSQLFDLREIWLEMIHECRLALEHALHGEDEDLDE